MGPDALSWLPTAEDHETDIDDDVRTYRIRDNEDVLPTDINVPQTNRDQYLDIVPIRKDANDNYDIINVSNAEVFLRERRKDTFSRNMAKEVGRAGPQFGIDNGGILCRTAKPDGILQWVVPQSLLRAIMYFAHFPRTGMHLGARQIHDTLRQILLAASNERRIVPGRALSRISETSAVFRSSTGAELVSTGWSTWIYCDGHTGLSTKVKEGAPAHHRDDRALIKTDQSSPIHENHGNISGNDIPWPLVHLVSHTVVFSDQQQTTINK